MTARRKRRTHAAPTPPNGRLRAWSGPVVGVLAAGAVAAALTTWRGLGIVETKQVAIETTVTEIRADTKAMRSQLDQLLGRLGVREP